jgi:hypothetical protein
MRKIHANDIRTGQQQLFENLGIIGGRTERGNNLGTAH